MPTKFKKSSTIRDKATGKNRAEHYYMHTTSTKELVEYLDNPNGQPKIKQKVRNELVRRGNEAT
jgi:hypothetical protein